MELTFGEQIKIILKRKNMTIRQLAELIEAQTGRPMSRQNLTQKLNRDNFQEQDMKEIAQALGCLVQISVIDPMEATVASLQAMMPQSHAVSSDDTLVLPEAQSGRTAFLEEPAQESHPENPLSDETMILPQLTQPEAQAAPDQREMPFYAVPDAEEQAAPEAAGAELKPAAETGTRGMDAPAGPAEEQPEEEDVDSDVLREIEMALMESIQKEIYGDPSPEEAAVPETEDGAEAEEELETWTEQEPDPAEEGRPEAAVKAPGRDPLSWARKRPAVWPKLFVPGEEEDAADRARPSEESPVPAPEEELPFQEEAWTEIGENEEPEFLDLDLEEDLDGGDISGVSAPYVMKREGTEEAEEEPEEPRYQPDAASISQMPGGDVSYASAPYVIPREPEEEPEAQPEELFVEIPLEELPQREIDDSEDTVQDFGIGAPKELDMEEKLASWDAAVKKRLERPILMTSEERRAKKAAREAEEGRAEEPPVQERVPQINPLTGEEYETNTVKHHPTKPDMLLVYDRDEHMWIEQAERAFHNFQIRKRAMLGKDYEPPVYLD